MAPTASLDFSSVSAETVPDGTIATTANTGLDNLSNQSGTAVWGTDADGRRYIEGSAGDRCELRAAGSGVTDANDHWAIEWEIEYSGTPTDSDTHSFFDLNSGSNRMIFRKRTNSAWDQNIRLQTFTSGNTVAGDVYERSFGDILTLGRKHWFGGFGYQHASNGYLGITVNGQAIAQYENIDTSAMALWPMGRCIPMDGANLTWRVYGYRYWNDSDWIDDFAPDWDYEDRYEYDYLEQLGPEYGPWEVTSGAGTFETDSSGIVSKEQRVRCGTNVTLELRSAHAFGTLDSFRGRAVIRDEMICLPASGSYDLRLGESSAGDIGIIAFDGTSGTSTTRPIKIGGVATGLTYEDDEPYCLDIIFDTTTNKSALVLTHLGASGVSDRRQWGAWWNRTGGIPTVNVVTRTVIGTNAVVGMMLAAPSVDYTYPSSYMSTNITFDAPLAAITFETANHIGAELDAFANPARGYHRGIMSNTSIGRTGNRLVNLTDWTGAFDSLQYLRAQRFVFPEQCINDFAAGESVQDILDAFQLQVNACKQYGVRMHGGSQLLLSAPTYDDDYRANMDAVNTGIKQILTNASRRDLFTYSDVRGQYSSQSAMDALIDTDDTHPTEAGRVEWADHFVNLLAPIGAPGHKIHDFGMRGMHIR